MEIEVRNQLYHKLLSLFVTEERKYRLWMETPFSINDLACATDGHAIIVFDKTLAPELIELAERESKNILNVIPKGRSDIAEISVSGIVSAFQKAPVVDGFDKKPTSVTCEACDGYGEVEFEFSHNCKTYEIDGDCPICKGIGQIQGFEDVPNGKQVPDPEYNYTIRGGAFSFEQLSRILKVAHMLEQESITLVFQEHAMGNHVFRVGNVEILQMPLSLSAINSERFILIA